MADFTEKLKDELVQQFREQPSISAIMETIGEQLQEVGNFFRDLRNERSINNATGAQLDGAGDIVVLSRTDAGELTSFSSPGEPVTDEIYRKYLIHKIWMNTNTCTYRDIIRSFKMFWDKPLYYSEDPDEPATMLFKTGVLGPGDSPERLLNAPIIRAAGVGIKVVSTVETPEMADDLFVAVIPGRGYTITELPEIVHEFHFSHVEQIVASVQNITGTTLPKLKEV